jgi:hypothetical protein
MDTWKPIDDPWAEPETFSWLAKQDKIKMPIAFEVRNPPPGSIYKKGRLMVFSGRHRIGYAISLDSDLQVFVLPYPKDGEELYSKKVDASIIHSNTQAFQSVYVNPDAKKWQDRIVIHDPIFSDEISGVVALKSYRLEDCLGFVLNAPISRIRLFRSNVKKADQNDQLGKEEPSAIMDTLLKMVEEIGGTITYLQNKKEGTPKENPEGEKPKGEFKPKKAKKGKSINFFDPITKRQLVKKGPQYFDPSLPTMEKEIDAANQKIYSPAVKVYPMGLTENGKTLWNETLDKIGKDIYQLDDTGERWERALYAFDKTCTEANMNPYKVQILTDTENIKAKMVAALTNGRFEIQNIYNELESCVEKKTRFSIEDVKVMGDTAFIIGSCRFKLLAKLDPEKALASISEGKITFKQNVVKEIDNRTAITLTPDKPYTLRACLSYGMPIKEAILLLGTDKPNQIRCGLIKIISYLRDS